MHTQGCQGCQKIRNLLRNSKILIARSTIQPKLSKIKKTLRNASKFIKKWPIVFDFTQFWLDGRPGNEYFWISHKISGPLTPLTPLGVHPQCLLKMQSETDWSNSSQCVLLCSVTFFRLRCYINVCAISRASLWSKTVVKLIPWEMQSLRKHPSK